MDHRRQVSRHNLNSLVQRPRLNGRMTLCRFPYDQYMNYYRELKCLRPDKTQGEKGRSKYSPRSRPVVSLAENLILSE